MKKSIYESMEALSKKREKIIASLNDQVDILQRKKRVIAERIQHHEASIVKLKEESRDLDSAISELENVKTEV